MAALSDDPEVYELEQWLRKADAAGDAISARSIIAEIEKRRSPGFFNRLKTNYMANVAAGVEGMPEGATQAVAPDSSLGDRALGAGKAALGALQYAASPIEAVSRTVVGDPAKLAARQLGASEGVANFVGDVANAGAQVFGAVPAAKAIQGGAQAVTKTARTIAALTRKTPAMTGPQLKEASQKAYQAAENAGVVIQPKSFSAFVDDLPKNIEDFHPTITPQVAPQATKIMDGIRAQAASGAPLTLSELDGMRRAVGRAATGTKDANEGRVLSEIRDGIDDYIDNLRQGDLSPFTSAKDAHYAISELHAARKMWHKARATVCLL